MEVKAATLLARQLANQKAQILYHCQPFADGLPAHLVRGRWEWQDRRGFGHGEYESNVSFAADGSAPTVEVLLLDSRGILQWP
jgi:hypothetical protein